MRSRCGAVLHDECGGYDVGSEYILRARELGELERPDVDAVYGE